MLLHAAEITPKGGSQTWNEPPCALQSSELPGCWQAVCLGVFSRILLRLLPQSS